MLHRMPNNSINKGTIGTKSCIDPNLKKGYSVFNNKEEWIKKSDSYLKQLRSLI